MQIKVTCPTLVKWIPRNLGIPRNFNLFPDMQISKEERTWNFWEYLGISEKTCGNFWEFLGNYSKKLQPWRWTVWEFAGIFGINLLSCSFTSFFWYVEMLPDLKKFEGLQLLREFVTTFSNSFSSKSQCFV